MNDDNSNESFGGLKPPPIENENEKIVMNQVQELYAPPFPNEEPVVEEPPVNNAPNVSLMEIANNPDKYMTNNTNAHPEEMGKSVVSTPGEVVPPPSNINPLKEAEGKLPKKGIVIGIFIAVFVAAIGGIYLFNPFGVNDKVDNASSKTKPLIKVDRYDVYGYYESKNGNIYICSLGNNKIYYYVNDNVKGLAEAKGKQAEIVDENVILNISTYGDGIKIDSSDEKVLPSDIYDHKESASSKKCFELAYSNVDMDSDQNSGVYKLNDDTITVVLMVGGSYKVVYKEASTKRATKDFVLVDGKLVSYEDSIMGTDDTSITFSQGARSITVKDSNKVIKDGEYKRTSGLNYEEFLLGNLF